MANIIDKILGPAPAKNAPIDDVNRPVDKTSQNQTSAQSQSQQTMSPNDDVSSDTSDEPYVGEDTQSSPAVHVVNSQDEKEEYNLPEEMMHGLKESDASIEKDDENIVDMENELAGHEDNIKHLSAELKENQDKKATLEENIAKTKASREKKVKRREQAIEKANEAVKKLMSAESTEEENIPDESPEEAYQEPEKSD